MFKFSQNSCRSSNEGRLTNFLDGPSNRRKEKKEDRKQEDRKQERDDFVAFAIDTLAMEIADDL